MQDQDIRVLMLLHNLGVGGAELTAFHLARELVGLGCRPVICAWRRGGPLEARIRAAGIPVVVPPGDRGGWRRLAVPRFLGGVVARHGIDLIHAHMSDSAAWGVLLQRLTGRPCAITHANNDLVDTVERGRLYRWARHRLLFLCAGRAAANVAVSASVRGRLAARVHLPAERLAVVPNAIPRPPAEAVERARAERRARLASGFAAGRGPKILYVGRLTRVKGVEALIAAAPALLARFPDATFTILGDGPARGTLRTRAQAFGVERKVSFPGLIMDVGPWLAAADLFASPSRIEGLPLASLEAMAWGLPVVLSDVPGHRDLARGGALGRLFSVGAPEALARALIAALEDRPATEARADRALALVRREHSADLMARRYLEIYRLMLERGARTRCHARVTAQLIGSRAANRSDRPREGAP
jgi:L-malate glycosyltransferase